MKRREALKTLGFAAAGLVALPAWARGWNAQSITLVSSTFTPEEHALLSAVSETIIPEKDGLGAVPLGVDKFLIRLLDECYEEDTQDNIKMQLNELNKNAISSEGKGFADCSQAQREELLLSFSDSGNESEEIFFRLLKEETIRGFRTSQVVMEDYYRYSVVPGYYNGNADAEA